MVFTPLFSVKKAMPFEHYAHSEALAEESQTRMSAYAFVTY